MQTFIVVKVRKCNFFPLAWQQESFRRVSTIGSMHYGTPGGCLQSRQYVVFLRTIPMVTTATNTLFLFFVL
jgi:hypothetical protein